MRALSFILQHEMGLTALIGAVAYLAMLILAVEGVWK